VYLVFSIPRPLRQVFLLEQLGEFLPPQKVTSYIRPVKNKKRRDNIYYVSHSLSQSHCCDFGVLVGSVTDHNETPKLPFR